MSRLNRRKRERCSLNGKPLEVLESRTTPAQFNTPWLDPQHLTLSFAPDGTKIGGQQSTLFQTLDQFASREDWQCEILRAFQTWAVHANINIGLTSDNGQAFGTPGKAQGEAGFGDIRIGSIPFSTNEVMISVPYNPIFAGTLSGDVTFNSSYQFIGDDHDHDDDDDHNESDDDCRISFADLFRGALHEAGHVFGLSHSDEPGSVMNKHLNHVEQLSASDIASLQTLYGERTPDDYEGKRGNDSFDKAAAISPPNVFAATVVYGDITTNSDIDFYEIQTESSYNGAMTFKVRTDGRSALAPKIKVYDDKKNLLAQESSTKLGGDTVTIRLAQITPSTKYYISVEAATNGEFGIGGYALNVAQDNWFASLNMAASAFFTNSNNDSALYQLLGPLSVLSANDRTPDELGKSGDQLSTNSSRIVLPGNETPSDLSYHALGNLASATDLDVFEVKAPTKKKGAASNLFIQVTGFGPNSAPPRIVVLNSQGQSVQSEVLTSNVSGYMVQVRNPTPGAKYLIRVEMPNNTQNVRFYQLDAVFSNRVVENKTFTSGTIAPGATKTQTLYVAQSQMIHLLLQTGGLAGLRMTIRNSSGQIVFQLLSNGDALSDYTPYLDPGAYTVEFASTNASKSIAYAISGIVLTDPVGPGLTNPIRIPIYEDNSSPGAYAYPNGTKSPQSYLFA